MSWIIPENRLDEQQRDFVDNVDINQRNVWIKGFPGSGKSVLLAYTIKKIKRDNPSASVVVVVFTHSLIKMFNAAFKEMGVNVEVITYFDFMKSSRRYDYILSDEVQDLTPSVLREMNSRGRHVIVAGDEHQSIYETAPKTNEATVSPSQINSLLNSRDFSLNIIHRLTSSIIDVVNRFLPNMNIFSAKRDMARLATQVRICNAQDSSEEVKYILKEGTEAVNNGYTAAVLIPTGKLIIAFINSVLRQEGKPEWVESTNKWGSLDFSALNSHLKRHNVPIQYVGNSYGNFTENSRKITVMTYHSAKGLDFDNVFLPYLNRNLFITYDEDRSKTLFMVAMTRSRNNLYLTYSGYKHEYLDKFSSGCHSINIHDYLNQQDAPIAGGGLFGDI